TSMRPTSSGSAARAARSGHGAAACGLPGSPARLHSPSSSPEQLVSNKTGAPESAREGRRVAATWEEDSSLAHALFRKQVPTFRDHALGRVVHLELDRVGGVLEADHFLHLELDVAVDEIVIEHAARFEEVAVLFQIAERLAQRAAYGWDLL